MFIRTLAALSLCLSLLLATPPCAALSPDQSLAQAAPELSRAAPATRAAFVAAAAAEIAAAHGSVLKTPDKGKNAAQGARWQRAARAYVGRLHAAADAARDGAAVRLVVEPDQTLRVVVGSRPARQFMVAAPRPDDQPRLERAILKRLCASPGCDGRLPDKTTTRLAAADGPPVDTLRLTPPAPLPRALPAVPFKAAPPAPRLVASLPPGDDGLGCAEDEVRHRVLHARACAALLGEARALLRALHGAARRGVVIDWGTPATPRSEGAQQVLAVNARGDVLRLSLPNLVQAPGLLVDILPWARARLYGQAQPTRLRLPGQLVYGAAVAAR